MSAHLRHPSGLPSARPRAFATSLLTGLLVLGADPLPPAHAHGGPVASQAEQRRTARLTVLPPIAHVGAAPAPSRNALTALVAELSPARAGRPLVVERRHHGRWRAVERTRQRANGRAEVTVRTRVAGRPVRYRVTAPSWRGLPASRTNGVWSTAWGAPGFVDEFAGGALSSAWEHRIQFRNPWGGRSCSKGDPSAVAVGDGALRLSVLPDVAEAAASGPCYPSDDEGNHLGDVPYAYRLNGHVSTQQSADFQYGVAAARMRFPRSRGQHAAFWLQPRGLLPDRPTPWGAEIDVVEWFGSSGPRDALASAVYRPTPDGSTVRIGGRYDDPDRFLDSPSDTWWDNYHVFSVEWTPTEYVFRIDGRETWRTSEGISHHPQFLILSQLSSDYELEDNPDATPMHADVDWVQFWRARP